MSPEEFFNAVENGTAPYVIKFRPQNFERRFKYKTRIRGYWDSCTFEKYYIWDRPMPINRKTLLKIHGQLHYLAHHAPLPVQKKWEPAERRFSAKHLPDCYYWKWSEKYTPNAWI